MFSFYGGYGPPILPVDAYLVDKANFTIGSLSVNFVSASIPPRDIPRARMKRRAPISPVRSSESEVSSLRDRSMTFQIDSSLYVYDAYG